MARVGGHKKARPEKDLEKQRRIKMKAQILKSAALAALTIVLIGISVNAQGKGGNKNSIIGAWDQVITFRDCNTGAALRTRPGLISFMFDGVMQEFGTGQQIPQNRTDGQGTWSHDTARYYTSVSKAFRFNPDSSLAGTAKLYRQIELSNDGESFNAVVNSEIYDANGVLVSQGCSTEVGTRLQ
jgi:hypothetical protein